MVLKNQASALVLAASLILGLPATALAQPHAKFGIVTNVFDAPHATKVSSLGTGWVRLGFDWWNIERSQDSYDWSFTDRWVHDVTSQGKRVYATLAYTPQWAGPAWTGDCVAGHCMPNALGDWYDFVWQVLNHFRGYGDQIVFGIWNEPDLQFLNDDSQATKYALLFQYAAMARDNVNPAARLAGPETSQTAIFNNSYFRWAMTKIMPFMHANDVITVHFYPNSSQSLSGYMGNVNLSSNGQEVWLTELGHATCTDFIQRSVIESAMNTFVTTSWAHWTKSFVYVLQDGSNCSDAIVRADWSEREAFTWYKSFIASH